MISRISLSLKSRFSRRVSILKNNITLPSLHQKGKMFKPFKPPLLKSVAKSAPIAPIDLTESDDEPVHRPYKKRKLLVHVVEDSPPLIIAPHVSSAVLIPRKPLLVVKNSNELKSTQDASVEGPEGYYMVLWYEVNVLPADKSSNCVA